MAQEAAHEEALRQEQIEHAKEASKMRQEVEAAARQLVEKYDRRVRAMTEEADAARKAEAAEAEERRNAHVQVSCSVSLVTQVPVKHWCENTMKIGVAKVDDRI